MNQRTDKRQQNVSNYFDKIEDLCFFLSILFKGKEKPFIISYYQEQTNGKTKFCSFNREPNFNFYYFTLILKLICLTKSIPILFNHDHI